jgi:hypothetical protein
MLFDKLIDLQLYSLISACPLSIASQIGYMISRRTTNFRRMGGRATGKMIRHMDSRILSVKLRGHMNSSMVLHC